MSGRKSSKLFFATFPQCLLLKADIAGILEPISESYVVGQERHADGNLHFHAVFKTVESFFLACLRAYLFIYLDPGAGLDLQVVRNKRACVHYVCKEDWDPARFGDVFKKELPFSVVCMDWVKENKIFSLQHSFILAHWTSYRFCENLHREYWMSQAGELVPSNLLKLVEHLGDSFKVDDMLFRNVEWVEDVFNWMQDSFVEPRRHKMPQLYLYGVPNVGKTSLINSMLRMDGIFFAGRDKWWMEGFRPDQFAAIILDEFNWETFSCKKELLKLLAGETFVANIKGVSPMRISVNIPVMMVTNDEPPSDPAFNVRIKLVYADEKCF
jgi:hypothetical protein